MLGQQAALGSQIAFVNAYLRHSRTPACSWIMDCTNKEELFLKGQDKLWASARDFHLNMHKLSNNGFKIDPNDTVILQQALEIVSTVHLMHAAEKGDIQFTPIEVKLIDEEEEKEDGPPVQDS
jgi:hypothetical protein